MGRQWAKPPVNPLTKNNANNPPCWASAAVHCTNNASMILELTHDAAEIFDLRQVL